MHPHFSRASRLVAAGQPVQKPVRAWVMQWLSVCSFSAKEDKPDLRQGISLPGQVILTVDIKQLWKIHLLPKLALILPAHGRFTLWTCQVTIVQQSRGRGSIGFTFISYWFSPYLWVSRGILDKASLFFWLDEAPKHRVKQDAVRYGVSHMKYLYRRVAPVCWRPLSLVVKTFDIPNGPRLHKGKK